MATPILIKKETGSSDEITVREKRDIKGLTRPRVVMD